MCILLYFSPRVSTSLPYIKGKFLKMILFFIVLHHNIKRGLILKQFILDNSKNFKNNCIFVNKKKPYNEKKIV